MTGLFEELKRRNVFRVGIAYLIAAWLILQVADIVLENIDAPGWVIKAVMLVLALGLPLALIFAWAFELTPEGLKKEREVDRSQSITNVTGRKLDYAIIGILALAVVVLLAERFIGPAAPEARQAGEKSIAVLPFVNMSSDSEQEYFSDGITEEILNSLAAIKELKVAGRTSSFAFKGRNEDLRLIGDTLGVEHILEGSVRKAGATVRITAQLIQVEDGFHMWSETYDRELTDVFAIQDEIATEILNQLKAQLLDEDLDALTAQRTDPEVYDLYLLAKQRLYARTRASIESAVDILDQAIAKDPEYVPAIAERGIAAILLSETSYGSMSKELSDRESRQFLDRAIALDPESAEAWAGLGLYHINRPSEHEQAADALAKALSINPNMIDASNWLYNVLQSTGDMQGALQLAEDMNERDPLYRPGFGNAVVLLNQLGQRDRAEALIERYRRFEPSDAQLYQAESWHHFFAGNDVEGIRLANKAYELAPSDAVINTLFNIGLLATQQMERTLEEGGDGWKTIAADYLGRRDEAFEFAFADAGKGNPRDLFTLYNRAGQSQELVDYLEERWPGLDGFAADYPHNGDGYALMVEIALAYSRTGNTERYEEALQLVENAVSSLSEQGVNNWAATLERAKYAALAGDHESALESLDLAIEQGMFGNSPLAEFEPVFAALRDDPRFIAYDETLAAKINSDRQAFGLEPIDPGRAFMAQ